MKIAAITRFKHGALFEALKELNWTQSEFARRCGIHASTMGMFLNLLKRPSPHYIAKMEIAFAEVGKVIDVEATFPDSYIGFKRPLKIVQVQDVEPKQLESFRQYQTQMLQDAQPPLPEDTIDTEDKLKMIEAAMNSEKVALTERERNVIKLHLLEKQTFKQIGQKYGVTGTTIQHNLMNGLYKIRKVISKEEPLEKINWSQAYL